MITSLQKAFYKEIGIAIIISSAFFIPYLNNYAPDTKEWEVWLFTLNFNKYRALQFMFIFLNCIPPILLFCIWFLTSEESWRWGILCPLFLNVGTITYLILDDKNVVIIPGTLIFGVSPLILLILIVDRKLKNSSKRDKSLNYVNSEVIPKLSKFTRSYFKKSHHIFTNISSAASKSNITMLVNLQKDLKRHLNSVKEEMNKNFEKENPYTSLNWYFMMTLFLFLPLLDNLYIWIPDTVKVLDLYIFKIGANHWRNVSAMLWFCAQRLSLIILLTIWFSSSKYWWKYSILIPISILILELIEALNPSSRQISEHEPVKGILILFLLLIIMIYIIRKIRYYFWTIELEKDVEILLNDITKKWSENNNKNAIIQKELNDLIKNKDSMELKDYLSKLNDLLKKL